MSPIAVVAVGAVTGLGRGPGACSVGDVGRRPATVVREVPWLGTAGLRRPFAALAAPELLPDRSASVVDPARVLLDAALTDLSRELDVRRSGWRQERVAVCLGSSSGGMASQIELFERASRGESVPAELAERATYFGPIRQVRRSLGLDAGLDVHVLAACASSTFSIGLGCRWLELGFCDIVIAGGYDVVTLLVAAGFESLAATSARGPRPFCTDRDGLSLGDGAAVMALARASEDPEEAPFSVLGFGASADAHHPTAPDPSGRFLCLAAERALSDAGIAPRELALISAHGTATAYNDAAELRMLQNLGADHPIIHPFKSVVGHTLGAAGAIELLSLRDAWESGVQPASAAVGSLEPAVGSQILEANRRGPVLPALKVSAAFGGANAALVVGPSRPRPQRTPRRVGVVAVGEPCRVPDVAQIRNAGAKIEEERLWRLDDLSALALTAVAQVERRGPVPMDHDRCGVIVGTAAATLEANARFDGRRQSRGVAFVEPRRFPATSPNLAAGCVAMAFGWHGPTVAVGAGLAAALEALLVAHDLVASGDADYCWCVAAEEVGDTVRRVWDAAGWPLPAAGAAAVLLASEGTPGQVVGWLVRQSLQSQLADAEQQLGALPGLEPGWPSLLAAGRLQPETS